MNSVKKLLGVGLLALAALFAAVPAQAQLAATGNGVSVNLALASSESMTISSPQANTTVNLVWDAANTQWDSNASPITVNLTWNLNATRQAIMLYPWLTFTGPGPFSNGTVSLASLGQIIYGSSIGGGGCNAFNLKDNHNATITPAGIGVPGQNCGGGYTVSTAVGGVGSASVTNITFSLSPTVTQNIPAGSYNNTAVVFAALAF